MRLFIAIQPDEKMKNALCRVQDSFKAHRAGGNYTPRENLHITLAFIGEYNEPDTVLAAMEKLEFKAFDIRLDRLGCFDDLWWSGFEDSPELEKLVKNLRRALASEGIPYDSKKFKAHISFLRRARLPEGRIAVGEISPVKMHVASISLMRSDRGKKGMIYTELGRVSGE